MADWVEVVQRYFARFDPTDAEAELWRRTLSNDVCEAVMVDVTEGLRSTKASASPVLAWFIDAMSARAAAFAARSQLINEGGRDDGFVEWCDAARCYVEQLYRRAPLELAAAADAVRVEYMADDVIEPTLSYTPDPGPWSYWMVALTAPRAGFGEDERKDGR